MRRDKFIVLFVALIVLASVQIFDWLIFKGVRIDFDPIFDLPEELPYIYCEIDESTIGTGDGRFVFFLFLEGGKINFTTAKADKKASFGKIFASDGKLISALNGTPPVTVSAKGEIVPVEENRWRMNFYVSNLDSALPRSIANDMSPVKPRNFPNIEGVTYCNLALNLAILAPLNLQGEFYATMASGAARWKGVDIPAILSRFYLGKKEKITKFFQDLHEKLQNEHEFVSSHGGLYSPAPVSLWLTEAKEFVELGILDESCIVSEALQSPMTESALLWAQFSPLPLISALDRALLQIKPGVSARKLLGVFERVERITILLKSLREGFIQWKIR